MNRSGTHSSLLAIGLLCLSVATSAAAAGSAEAGQAKSAVCAACHGADGNSLNPIWPSLAGQNAAYIVHTLKAFKKGDRSDPTMTPQAMSLSDEDMADLAAYFSSKTRQPGTARPDLAPKGELLYRGGNKDSGIAACMSCHGPTGAGNAPAGYPSIAGQHETYTANQLKAYRSEQRASDPNQMMRNNTARLTDAEIEALASYIQGLR